MAFTDRNAKDSLRLRRNAQRTRDGALTSDITLSPTGGIENTPDGLALKLVFNEPPTGTINGSNAVFTLAHVPVDGTLLLYVNGVLTRGGGNDYDISGTSVTFVAGAIPVSGDWLLATYLRA